jgi:hypothetical protein
MKGPRYVIGIVVVLITAYYCWLIFGSGDFFFSHARNALNRAAILKMRDELRPGDGYEKVLRSYWQHTSSDLQLYSGSPKSWSVSTPYQIGAREWVLRLDFTNGKLSAIRVRTADGPRPDDAPEDIEDSTVLDNEGQSKTTQK